MKSRILVVEDSPTQARAVCRVLESAGYEVELAVTGEAGVAQFDAQRYDLVVSDVVMPGTIDGYELCRRIKGTQTGRSTPVMLLTSLTSPMDIIHGLASGADNFLTKPYDDADLAARVGILLRTREARNASKLRVGVDVFFMGQTFTITSNREQILDLLISTFEDAVRQNQALRAREDELREARAELARYAETLEVRLESVMQSVPDILFSMSADMSRMTYVSPAALAVTGFAPEEFVADAGLWLGRVVPADAEHAREAFTRSRRGERANALFRMRHRDDSERWLDTTVVPTRDASGRVERLEGIARDVTEARLLEHQLRQSQKMELVGQLAGGVAHDFNNFLCVILGWTSLLLEDAAPAGPDRESLEEIQRAGESASKLTRQLLSFSRQQVVEATIVEVNDFVVSADKLFQRLIGERVEWRTRLDPAVGAVRVDSGQLEQVLMNLVVNARDAMPEGGTLTLETGEVVLSAHDPRLRGDAARGAYVLIAVSDTGTGMSAAVRERIFEPFYTTKGRDKGTGLGLATCDGIVRQAGGFIDVRSEEGRGTTMTVYLPRNDGVIVESPSVRRSGPAPTGGATIMLVEDDESVHRVTVRMLEGLGHTVVSARTGEEALAILERATQPVDLLLTDVVLGQGMTGAELAERVNAKYPALAILFASGYTSDVAIVQGLLERGMSIIQKPFSAEALGHKVREVLDGG